MTFPTAALQAGDYTKLRSAKYAAAGYVSLCPNNVVWSTTLSATASGVTNAQVSYGTTITGNVSDVQVGHRILIGTANDIRQATFNGRVRVAPSGGILGINETSDSLTSGMYLWVVDDYPLRDKLSRPVGTPPIQYVDFDTAYQGLLPVVVGLQKSYTGFINSSNKLRIAFDVSGSYAAESGATISSYLFTFAAATYTVISGSLSTAIVTVDLTEGFQWGKLVVTDSGGRSQTRHFEIHAHGSTYTPALSFQGASIQDALAEGWSTSAEAFADVSTMLDNTPITFWTQEWYNDVEGPIVNTINAIGWMRSETDPATGDPIYSLITSSQFAAAGMPKLGRIEMQLLALSNNASPTEWDEINNLTPWRGIIHILQRHSTLLELVDLTFDDTSDTFLFPYLSTQGGNLLAAVNGIADQINAALEFAPDGAIQVVRNALYLDSTARNALLTYADWTSADYLSISLQYTHEQGLGRVDADGAYYQTSAGTINAFKSRAPGLAQDIGPDLVNLSNQILTAGTSDATAQDELDQRAGNAYEINSTPTYYLDVVHPDGYHFLIPSNNIWYTWTLAAGTDNIRGLSYTTSNRWLLISASYQINNDTGLRELHHRYRLECPIGNPGTAIQIPADGSLDLSIPAIPPLDPFPAFPTPLDFYLIDPTASQYPPFQGQAGSGLGGHAIVAPRDGNTVDIWTVSQVFVTRSWSRSSPVWTEITPPGISNIVDCRFTNTGQGMYVLSDNADAGGSVSHVYNFLSSNEGFVTTDSTIPGTVSAFPATWTLSGWQSTVNPNFSNNMVMIIVGTFTSFTINSIIISYTTGAAAVGGTRTVQLYSLGTLVYTPGAVLNTGTGSFTTTLTPGGIIADKIWIELDTANTGVPANYITNLTLTGTGSSGQAIIYSVDVFNSPPNWNNFPLPAGDNGYTEIRVASTPDNIMIYKPSGASVRLSTDNGETFGSTVSVGATPGAAGGFDLSRIGNTSVGAADAKARKATTLGGAYSDHTAYAGTYPLLIYIPRRKFGGTTTNASLSDPDYLVATPAQVGGDSVWKVSGGVLTAITPSVGGTDALAVGPNSAAMNYLNGNVIALIASISGTAHLFTSTDATNWTDRGAMSGALAVSIRKSDRATLPGVYIAGGTILKYGKNLGATLVNKTKPISSGILGVEVLG